MKITCTNNTQIPNQKKDRNIQVEVKTNDFKEYNQIKTEIEHIARTGEIKQSQIESLSSKEVGLKVGMFPVKTGKDALFTILKTLRPDLDFKPKTEMLQSLPNMSNSLVVDEKKTEDLQIDFNITEEEKPNPLKRKIDSIPKEDTNDFTEEGLDSFTEEKDLKKVKKNNDELETNEGAEEKQLIKVDLSSSKKPQKFSMDKFFSVVDPKKVRAEESLDFAIRRVEAKYETIYQPKVYNVLFGTMGEFAAHKSIGSIKGISELDSVDLKLKEYGDGGSDLSAKLNGDPVKFQVKTARLYDNNSDFNKCDLSISELAKNNFAVVAKVDKNSADKLDDLSKPFEKAIAEEMSEISTNTKSNVVGKLSLNAIGNSGGSISNQSIGSSVVTNKLGASVSIGSSVSTNKYMKSLKDETEEIVNTVKETPVNLGFIDIKEYLGNNKEIANKVEAYKKGEIDGKEKIEIPFSEFMSENAFKKNVEK